MAFQPRFSVLVLPTLPWPELLRRCRRVEALGFDALCLADHFTDWTGRTGPWYEMWTHLAAIAQATSRIRIATLVAQIPLREPAMFALQALTADHISGGRLEIGLGTGLEVDPSYRMMGIENWPAGQRVARFPEYVEIVHRLLTEEVVTHQGRFHRLEGATLGQRPIQAPRPPITIAALGPVMLRHAARWADTWNSLSFARDSEAQLAETRQRIATLDAACAAIGRDPASLRRSYLMFDPTARAGGGRIAYYESERAFRDMAGRVLALGITDIVLYHPIAEDQMAVFERIAATLLPMLRG
ncbi:MAG: LLM class flavin-dependent oxidoreductase [Acetobacteraceae bacterium]|nr:LLM class flavin-dependent oxidoreductase [Acetobacteraceae bacterium]